MFMMVAMRFSLRMFAMQSASPEAQSIGVVTPPTALKAKFEGENQKPFCLWTRAVSPAKEAAASRAT